MLFFNQPTPHPMSAASPFDPASSVASADDGLERYIAKLASNLEQARKAQRHGLVITSISWEDAGRYKGSSWGPNISDMSLRLPRSRVLPYVVTGATLPMIRYPNFVDKTADLPVSAFRVTVGNETAAAEGKAQDLKRIPLKDYLQNIGQYVKTSSGVPCPPMWCEERDAHILTSAQFCVLPLGSGTTEFNVHLYNYQSASDDPAVLVLVCSQKGTSAQAIFGGTTQLYFNNAGDAANYVAERLKHERQRLGKNTEAKMDSDEVERNALFIVQIPLKTKPRPPPAGVFLDCAGDYKPAEEDCEFDEEEAECEEEEESARPPGSAGTFGVDRAMLSVGKTHSKFEGIKDFTLERDPRFPIRITVQRYLVTDQQDIPDAMWAEMKAELDSVYAKAQASGSLVTELNTGRKTEWDPKGEHKPREFLATLPASAASQPIFDF